MSDFTIGGLNYRSTRMDAFTQFHVLRRLTPVISSLKDLATAAPSVDLQASIGPLAAAIAAMSDADCNYVLGACLGVVQRQEPGDRGWARIWNADTKHVMFQDIDMAVMLQIALNVLQDAFTSFFSALPQP